MEGQQQPGITKSEEVASDTRRGGDVRTLLSPKSVGSTSGFMGVATLAAGDWISEHYHPYSEEFIYVVRGAITARARRRATAARHGARAVHPAQREAPAHERGRPRRHSSSSTSARSRRGRTLGHVDTEERRPAGETAGS